MKLHEVEFDFSKDVGDTISSVKSLAKRLHGAFSADARAEQDLAKKAAAEKAAQEKAAAKSSNKKGPDTTAVDVSGAARAVASGAPPVRVNLASALVELIDKPVEAFLSAFADLDASEFQDVLIDIQKLDVELNSFSKNFKTLMKASSFLSEPEKSNDKLEELTQPIDGNGAEEKLLKSIVVNPNGLQSALVGVLIDTSLGKSGKPILRWLSERSAYNQRVNDASTMSENRAVGHGLARMFNAYVIQVLVPRIEEVIPRLKELENKPVTTEAVLQALRVLR